MNPGRPSRPDRGAASSFVGRDQALAHLDASLAAARAGRFTAVLVSGPAGMGKTRLLGEFVAGLEGAGEVLWGTCPAEGGEFATLGGIEHVIRQLGLDVASPSGGGAAGAAGVEQQVRGVVETIRGVARARGFAVLVLDDLQWADDTTLEFLRFAAHALAHDPVLFVGTHRDGSSVEAPLRGLLTSLDRQVGCSRLPLEPLAHDDVVRLVADRVGEPVSPRDVDELVRRCDGVTLFIEELARGLRVHREPVVSDRLRDVLLTLVAGLGMGARELLDWAVVCGPTFPHELLAEVAELPAATLEKRLDELLDAELLLVDRPARGYRFRHVLVHEAVRDQLRPMTLRRLHARCARVLQARPDLTPGDARPCIDLARRWSAAGQAGPAFRAFRQAADEASRRGAHAEAARLGATAHEWFQRLPVAERAAATAVELLEQVADAVDRSGDHAEGARWYERALAAGPGSDVRPRLHVGLFRARYLAGDIAGAGEAAAAGLCALEPATSPGDRAVVLATFAGFVAPEDGPDAGLRRTTEAVAIARECGDPAVLADVLSFHGLALAREGDPQAARAALAEADRLAAGLADPRAVLRPPVFTMLLLHAIGATHAVVELGRATMRRADDLGVARGVGQEVRTILADCLVALGRWEEAAEVVEDGLAWGDDGLAGTLLLATKVDIAIHRGRFVEAERDLASVRERVPEGHFRASLAASQLAWWRRDAAASAAHAADGLALVGRLADPDEVGRLAHALVRAVDHVDAPDLGLSAPGDVVEMLTARAGHPVVDAWLATITATTATEPRDAARAWDDAHARWQALERLPMAAISRWRAGAAHAQAGDPTTARARLQDARGAAQELGAVPLGVEVAAALAAVGPSRPRDPGELASGTDGPGSDGNAFPELTDREAQVLALVARGWTNRRVGDELGISPRTVGTHVSRVLDKLGVMTRGEAAAVYHQSEAALQDST